ncbi:MAG: bifunctional hydroxymethylpyrimidine kinase/phosphomethylpyrimidine kinase, partial [Gammaproteobacteria bacterium]|nr:bifunctional hydroxymethylpyrimidine kinase/phosphomethylpyrimidine kinase [Gammaproteobacteria bacterium]
ADTDARARVLLDKGALWVLAKGGDAATDDVRNVLYGPDGFRQAWTWPRLPGRFHGSGCTLASALAALIANGCAVVDAVARAQQYTAQTLEQAWRPGQGQQVPRRIVEGVRQ